MATAAQVAIDIVTDPSRATAGFDRTASSAQQMATKVESAGRTAAIGMDNISSSADDLGGKAGRATGALGALASGAELGGPSFAKYGTALQTAALATDFMSGVGDALNLVLESTILKNIRARVTTIAKTVAEKAAAAATKAMAVAQWALNAAMSANPIGLVVLAIAALVAGFVLAYKKSETFRAIVQTVGRVGKEALGWIVDRIQDVIDIAGKVIGWFKDKIPAALETLGNVAKRIGDVVLAPFRTLQSIIEKVIDLIGKIKIPDIPDWVPGVGRAAATSATTGTATAFIQPIIQVTVQGFIGTPDQLVEPLARAFQRAGRQIATT